MTEQRQRVLFVCTHNSARSQMAEALLRHLRGDRCDAFSAGTEATAVHPLAARAMAEIGVDIGHQRSKSIEEFRHEQFDYVITVCDHAKETCPFFRNATRYLHWSLPDPAQAAGSDGERLDAFRSVRNEIRRRLEETFG